jgi:hypothetical protein
MTEAARRTATWLVIAVLAVLLTGAARVAETSDAARGGVCRLIARTQEFHRLIGRGAVKRTVKLRSASSPKRGKAELDYLESLAEGLEEYEAHVLAVVLRGDQARVKQRVVGKYRKKSGRWDLRQDATWYWIFEEGDWYRLPQKPLDWDEAQSVAVPLPADYECP